MLYLHDTEAECRKVVVLAAAEGLVLEVVSVQGAQPL